MWHVSDFGRSWVTVVKSMGSVWLELRTLCSGVFEARSETRSPDLAVDAWVAVVFTGVLFAVNWGVRLWLVAPAACAPVCLTSQ